MSASAPGADVEADMVADANVVDARVGDPSQHRVALLSRTGELPDRREDPHSNSSHAQSSSLALSSR